MSGKLRFGRLASVPDDAGDGFTYNAPWRFVSASGRPLNEKAILRLSAAMACVRLLSQTIATLPIGLFERLADGSRKAANGHPLYEVLHNQPNADMTAVDFWQVVVASMLLRGNAISELTYSGTRVTNIEPLDPCRVEFRETTAGDLEYFYSDGTGGARRKIPANRIWHIPAFTLNGRVGISPICYGAGVFGAAMSTNDAADGVFENGLSASGFITTAPAQWLTPEQREAMRTHMDEFSYGSKNSFKSMILEGGMGFTPIKMNPQDAQMLETRAFNIEEICRWYGVPPTLIGHGDKTSNWGTGLEQQNLSFLTYSLRAWLSKIEQSIRKNLLSPADKARYFAEFSVEGLLRADSAGRAAYYRTMSDIGALTIDDIRRKENLPVFGGNAAVPLVQTARIQIDKLGQTAVIKPPPEVPEPEVTNP